MAADPSTATNFLVSTDYPLDKVVVGGTVSFTVPATTNGLARLPHGLPFAPLVMGSYSYTSDYAILYGLNSAPVSSVPAFRLYDSVVKINSTNTEVLFSGENYTANPVTFYVRYYGLVPTSALDYDLTATQSLVDDFQLNTDYNYTKLFMAGYYDYPTSGSATNVTTTIPHGLGRIPQIVTWREDGGQVAPLMGQDAGVIQIENAVTSLDANNLYIKIILPASQPLLRVHYRIYLDE